MNQIEQAAVKSFNDSFIVFDLSSVTSNLGYNLDAPASDTAAQR